MISLALTSTCVAKLWSLLLPPTGYVAIAAFEYRNIFSVPSHLPLISAAHNQIQWGHMRPYKFWNSPTASS
jgi:hypothetical protein